MLPSPPHPASSGRAPDEQTSSAWTSSGTRQIKQRDTICKYYIVQFSTFHFNFYFLCDTSPMFWVQQRFLIKYDMWYVHRLHYHVTGVLVFRTEHICCFSNLSPWDRSLSTVSVQKHMANNDSRFDEAEMIKSLTQFGKMPLLNQNYIWHLQMFTTYCSVNQKKEPKNSHAAYFYRNMVYSGVQQGCFRTEI